MKSPPFEYEATTSVEHALGLLADLGDEAKVLAGGQSLVPLLHLRLARPSYLVDINGLADLASVRDGNGSGVELGAMVRHREAEVSEVVRTRAPLLAAAIRLVGHAAIRTRGTVGGSVAHADPAAELPTALTALDAEMVATSVRGERSIGADAFFQGFLTTALEPDELLTAIRVPAWPAATGWAFEEFSRRHGDFAIVGAATTVSLAADGTLAGARIALSGASGVPFRATDAERLLAGETPSPELWVTAAQRAAANVDPPADLHGSAAYRRQLVATLTKRALEQACLRAREAS